MGGWERVRKEGGGPPPGQAFRRQLCGLEERPPFCPSPSWGLQYEARGGRGQLAGGEDGGVISESGLWGEVGKAVSSHPGSHTFSSPNAEAANPPTHPPTHPFTHSRIPPFTHSDTVRAIGYTGSPVSVHSERPAGQLTTRGELSTRTLRCVQRWEALE